MNMLLAITLIFSFLNSAKASQEVIVKAEKTIIHESPDDQSDGLVSAKKGNTLKASSSSRSGWYKIELPTKIYGKRYGWIKKSDVDSVKVLYPDNKVSTDITSDQKKNP
ncbi:MAG: hypothetical protein KA715_00865 [Xanthomonadaceae bacterium]|nr:hypothetical protein [Xanthomonadaceae bacterium]